MNGRSKLEKRSQFQNTYLNPDGTRTAEIGHMPLNVKDGDGEWVPIDKTITKDKTGALRPGAHPLSPRFAAKADAKELVRAGTDDGWVALSLPEAAPVKAAPVGRGRSCLS